MKPLLLLTKLFQQVSWHLWLSLFALCIAVILLQKFILRPLASTIQQRSSNRVHRNPVYIIFFAVSYAMKWILLYLSLVFFATFVALSPESLALWNQLSLFFLLTGGYAYVQGIVKYHLADLLHFLIELDGKEDVIHRIRPLLRAGLRTLSTLVYILSIMNFVLELNISSWLAGLGVLGLGMSLAMQDTFSNLIATITIAVTKPFKEGDRIVFSGIDGIVENIGLRSSSIRTLSGNVVTVANSQFTSSPVENIAERPYIKRMMQIGITYDTPKDNIAQAVRLIKNILSDTPENKALYQNPDLTPRVYFQDFAASELIIQVLYWFQPPSYWDYMDHAQMVNERIFAAFDSAGIDFAFPTQTLHLASDNKRKLALSLLGQDLSQTVDKPQPTV